MRVDAARNLDAVLQTGARLLAEDPATSVATIATEAGVDRRTVYRHFASREALLCAVFDAKVSAIEEVLTDCRLREAPIAVAMHRFVEGLIAVVRRYPVGYAMLPCSAPHYPRMLEQRERIETFLRRAVSEGMIRADLPDGVAFDLMGDVIELLGLRHREIECGRAADIAVEILLGGIGRHDRSS
jgi:AcrR family transcriptional regulator